jgi:hypothetical protein
MLFINRALKFKCPPSRLKVKVIPAFPHDILLLYVDYNISRLIAMNHCENLFFNLCET